MINDGSEDNTFSEIKTLMKEFPEITHAVDFFSNNGQLAAMSCGVDLGEGENFIFIDSDLQLDPEEIPLLMERFDEGYHIVSGKRRNRQDSLLRKLPSLVANRIMAKVSGHPLTDFGCTFKIYRGDLVRPFNFGPYKPWKTAFVFRQARKVIEVDISHHERRYGSSGWGIKKLLYFLFDQVTGLSQRPFLWVAFFSAFISGIIILRLIITPFLDLTILPQISNGLLLNVLLLIIMLQLSATAFLGEFVFRVFARSEGDPIYTIMEHITRDPSDEKSDQND